jgi:hypothetical protein
VAESSFTTTGILQISGMVELPGRVMLMTRTLAATLVLLTVACTGSSTARAADCEDIIARHMVGQALLAAHFVAQAEKAGMQLTAINANTSRIANRC